MAPWGANETTRGAPIAMDFFHISRNPVAATLRVIAGERPGARAVGDALSMRALAFARIFRDPPDLTPGAALRGQRGTAVTGNAVVRRVPQLAVESAAYVQALAEKPEALRWPIRRWTGSTSN